MAVEEAQRVEWFAEFERTGETAVRMQIDSDNGGGNLSRLACAREWLRQKEESRALAVAAKRDAREEETLEIARQANVIARAASRWAMWAAIIAVIAIAIEIREQIIAFIAVKP